MLLEQQQAEGKVQRRFAEIMNEETNERRERILENFQEKSIKN